jgi:hypothetical protein
MKAALPKLFFAFTFIFHFSFFIFNFSFVSAQVPTVQDCMGAIPVCQDIYVEENSYSGDGNYNNEIYEDLPCDGACPGSCLAGEVNSVWYIWTVQAGGVLRLTIDPVNDSDDYDWAVYDLTELRCSDIYSSYALMQKSCNAYGVTGFNGNTGISSANGGSSNCNNCGQTNLWNVDLNVLEGRTYVLIIENWSGTTMGYTLDFGASTAIIYDDVRPELALVLEDEITCGDIEIVVEFSENVMCESVDPTDFIFAGPGGPYVVLDAQGETCLLGGTMEKRYTLIIDKPIRADGTYSVQLAPLNFVYDACNNFALGNTITFNVDLGAPFINIFGLTITAATCGLSNGSITGLQIIGTPPYGFEWTDEYGNTVGTSIDLIDVPTGNYFLAVTDENTCETVGGPYFIDQTGAPAIDETGMVITGANWGANNGSITGLEISGNEPLVFLWTDDLNNPVGSDPDLLDVYSGNYYLLVTDVYGCDTLAGPYFVQQIGGPIGVEASANPTSLCAGLPSELHATAFGGTGTYTFLWTSIPPGFSSELQSPVVYPMVTTTYNVTISDGYNPASSSTSVTVNPIPVSNAGDDQTIPYGTSTTIYGAASGGTSTYYFSWEPADLLINPTAQNPASHNLYQTTLFRLRATDSNTGCASIYDTVIVSLEGGPLGVTVSMQDDTICNGESTTITAYGFGGNYSNYTYTWYYGTDLVKVETNVISSLDILPATNGNHTYTVKIDDGYNEFTSDIAIYVAPTPAFIIQSPGYSIQDNVIIACPADTVDLQPDNLFTEAEYYWSNGATMPVVRMSTTGIGFSARTIALTITNQDGCKYADSVTVIFDFAACFGIEEYHSFPEIKVYPNPTSGIINVELEEGIGFSSLQILNMQGSQVFSKQLSGLLPGKNVISIDMAGYPQGVYLLRAIHDRFIHHQKVVLN